MKFICNFLVKTSLFQIFQLEIRLKEMVKYKDPSGSWTSIISRFSSESDISTVSWETNESLSSDE